MAWVDFKVSESHPAISHEVDGAYMERLVFLAPQSYFDEASVLYDLRQRGGEIGRYLKPKRFRKQEKRESGGARDLDAERHDDLDVVQPSLTGTSRVGRRCLARHTRAAGLSLATTMLRIHCIRAQQGTLHPLLMHRRLRRDRPRAPLRPFDVVPAFASYSAAYLHCYCDATLLFCASNRAESEVHGQHGVHSRLRLLGRHHWPVSQSQTYEQGRTNVQELHLREGLPR